MPGCWLIILHLQLLRQRSCVGIEPYGRLPSIADVLFANHEGREASPWSDYNLSVSGYLLILGSQQIKQLLNGGTATIIGYAEINGHKAVGVSVTKLGEIAQFWADTTTYQVVRAVYTVKVAGGIVMHETDNYTWLPRSASLLKQMTTPVIPAGFKRLAQLP